MNEERDRDVAKLAEELKFEPSMVVDDPRVAEKTTEIAAQSPESIEEMARAMPALYEIYTRRGNATKEDRQAMFNEVLGTFSKTGFIENAKQLIGIIDLRSERYKTTKEEVDYFIGKFPRFGEAREVVVEYVSRDRKVLGLKQ